ncbi:hypothetical protein [Pelomonas sp. SE-A7]|uniref:hypothetical protein n=1 Tax=Pelomonas sp. SE-A7 TaxID=3054953 RepID=UPI00259CE998|nr:hypothetical protein [Pelomonas sp. SE-A7]MDM4767186.1 hypothetical protein [Pelomonas sp. SE-A7]
MRRVLQMLLLFVATVLVGCSSGDPGRLGGSWQMVGPVKMKVHFRQGEVEALGIIDKVSYESKGNDVVVTYESGLMKGTAMRYTLIGNDTVRSELGDMKRTK